MANKLALTPVDLNFFTHTKITKKRLDALIPVFGPALQLNDTYFTINEFKEYNVPFAILNVFTSKEHYSTLPGQQWRFGAYNARKGLLWYYAGNPVVFDRKEAIETYQLLLQYTNQNYSSDKFKVFAHKEIV